MLVDLSIGRLWTMPSCLHKDGQRDGSKASGPSIYVLDHNVYGNLAYELSADTVFRLLHSADLLSTLANVSADLVCIFSCVDDIQRSMYVDGDDGAYLALWVASFSVERDFFLKFPLFLPAT